MCVCVCVRACVRACARARVLFIVFCLSIFQDGITVKRKQVLKALEEKCDTSKINNITIRT